MTPEPLPPGETGMELTGVDAIAAIELAQMQLRMAAPPVERLTLSGLDIRRDGRWIAFTCRFFGRPGLTVRLARAWAERLRARLTEVLDA
jgi:hypothetical protein